MNTAQKAKGRPAPQQHTRNPTDLSLVSALSDGLNDSLYEEESQELKQNNRHAQMQTIPSGADLDKLAASASASLAAPDTNPPTQLYASNLKKAKDGDVVVPSDGLKITTSESQIHPETLRIPDSLSEYTVDDILTSNMEGEDESDQIRKLERIPSLQQVTKDSLFPRIANEFLDNLQYNEDHKNDDDDDKDDGSSPSNDSQKLTSRDSNDLAELTKQLAYMPTTSSNESQTTKTGADLYYHNAARIFPKRTSSTNIRTEDFSGDVEMGSGEIAQDSEDGDPSKKKKHGRWEINKKIGSFRRRRKEDLEFFKEFAEPHKKGLFKQFLNIVTYIMLPSLIMACLLFYGFKNPPNGVALEICKNVTVVAAKDDGFNDLISQDPEGLMSITRSPTKNPTSTPSISRSPSQVPTMINSTNPENSKSPTASPTRKPTFVFSDKKNATTCVSERGSLKQASISWWFLFIGVRQATTFCLAVVMQLFFVDFLTFRTRFFPKLLGTKLALGVGQSKGWPCILFFWAIVDMIFLFGKNRFARHWLYYQEKIDLMNSTNPSGDVPDNKFYKRIIYFAIALSIAETTKRTIMANFVGQRVVAYYRLDLSRIIKKLLTLGEVAKLSNDATPNQMNGKKSIFTRMNSIVDRLKGDTSMDDDETEVSGEASESRPNPRIMTSAFIAGHSNTFMTAIYENLDEWEEPELLDKSEVVSTTDVLHFRRAVDFINSDYPFSPVFGKATTREECAKASQTTFDRLVCENVLNFDVLCKIARKPDGTSDQKKVLELVRLFRPNRDGEISKLDFVKSIDSVYKQLRLLLANINNSSQIDRAYGQLANVFFFVAALIAGLFIMDVDVKQLGVTISAFMVAIAFMIGAAASKYLEGILLILVRKPYDIGDKVSFVSPDAPVSNSGPISGWIVENVNLYTTTVRLGSTREYATFTNGSLSNSRIVNLKRSGKANIYMYLKFTIDVSKEQLDEFRRRIIVFIKDRPREWIKVVGLRCTDIETELQYLKFVLIVQHRESWQSAAIYTSQGDVYLHALHLQKELNMNYTAPTVPVQLTGSPTSALARGLLGGGGNDFANRDASLTSSRNSWLDDANNNPAPRTAFDNSLFDDTEVKLTTRAPATQSNAGAIGTTIDGPVIRRAVATKNTSSGTSRVSFHDEQLLDETKNKRL